MRRIELKDDGSYVMMPGQLDNWRENLLGRWKVQGNTILWRDDKSGLIDANPMEDVRDGHFQVVENDGSRTQFERIEAKSSTRCDQTSNVGQE